MIFTINEGHWSIAQTVSQILVQNHWQVQIRDLILGKNGILDAVLGVHRSFYQYFPSLFQVPFHLSKNRHLQKQARNFFRDSLIDEVGEEIANFLPDVVITTYFVYSPAISCINPRNFQYINILADPVSFHPLTLDAFCDQIFVYNEKASNRCQRLGILKEKIKVSGWFVQDAFYQTYDRKLILKKLQFEENVFTLLVCGGSEGTNAILKIIPTLLTANIPLQVIIVCGSNKVLYHSLRLLRQTTKILSKDNLNIKLFQSTNIMPELIACSDLVMGKAGPNLLFETVVGRKPFFAICHISGQEDGNLELIKQKNLGFVEENPFQSGKLLKKIIKRPQMLDQFQKSIGEERKYNLHAAEVLLNVLT